MASTFVAHCGVAKRPQEAELEKKSAASAFAGLMALFGTQRIPIALHLMMFSQDHQSTTTYHWVALGCWCHVAMPPKLGGKKRFHKKKKRTAALRDFADEETGETPETAEFVDEDESSWRSAPVRGIGIIVLSIVAGFSLASLVLQPWRDIATDSTGVRGEFPVPDMLTMAADAMEPLAPEPAPAAAEPLEPAPEAAAPAPAVQVVKLPATRQPGNFNDPRVLWVHLHSYGGTTICDLARAHGEKVSPPKDNCNIMPDGCSTPKAFRIPCRKRAVSTQYTFSAVERVLDEDDLKCSGGPQNMLFGIMLRDPVAGLKSTLIGNEFEKGIILQTLRSHVVTRNLAFHFCLPPFDTYQHFDNFAVRTLSGDYDVAPGEVTRQHLEKAKGVLSKLDVVLIMEDLTDHLAQLRAVFGWDVDVDRSVWHSHWHRIPKNVFSVQEAAFLKEVNHLDYELYDFAQTLARQLTAQAQQRLSR
eukprot:s1107_g10.t1